MSWYRSDHDSWPASDGHFVTECSDEPCHDEGHTHLHVFTAGELRARDVLIIRSALSWWDADGSYGCEDDLDHDSAESIKWIIAQAESWREVDQ